MKSLLAWYLVSESDQQKQYKWKEIKDRASSELLFSCHNTSAAIILLTNYTS